MKRFIYIFSFLYTSLMFTHVWGINQPEHLVSVFFLNFAILFFCLFLFESDKMVSTGLYNYNLLAFILNIVNNSLLIYFVGILGMPFWTSLAISFVIICAIVFISIKIMNKLMVINPPNITVDTTKFENEFKKSKLSYQKLDDGGILVIEKFKNYLIYFTSDYTRTLNENFQWVDSTRILKRREKQFLPWIYKTLIKHNLSHKNTILFLLNPNQPNNLRSYNDIDTRKIETIVLDGRKQESSAELVENIIDFKESLENKTI